MTTSTIVSSRRSITSCSKEEGSSAESDGRARSSNGTRARRDDLRQSSRAERTLRTGEPSTLVAQLREGGFAPRRRGATIADRAASGRGSRSDVLTRSRPHALTPSRAHALTCSRGAPSQRAELAPVVWLQSQRRPGARMRSRAENRRRPTLASEPSKPRQRPTLPQACACSTIGPEELNFRVRDGNGCDLSGIAARKKTWTKCDAQGRRVPPNVRCDSGESPSDEIACCRATRINKR